MRDEGDIAAVKDAIWTKVVEMTVSSDERYAQGPFQKGIYDDDDEEVTTAELVNFCAAETMINLDKTSGTQAVHSISPLAHVPLHFLFTRPSCRDCQGELRKWLKEALNGPWLTLRYLFFQMQLQPDEFRSVLAGGCWQDELLKEFLARYEEGEEEGDGGGADEKKKQKAKITKTYGLSTPVRNKRNSSSIENRRLHAADNWFHVVDTFSARHVQVHASSPRTVSRCRHFVGALSCALFFF